MPARRRHRRSRADAPETTVTLVEAPEQVAALGAAIFDPERARPLLVVTSASDSRRPRIDVDDAARLWLTTADVAVVSVDAARTLSTLLPHHLRVYGGAVRIFLPGARPDDEPLTHPLFVTRSETQAGRTLRHINGCLHRLGWIPQQREPGQPSGGRGDPPKSHEDEAAALRSELASAKEALAEAQEWGRKLSADNSDLRRQLRSLTDQVAEAHRRLHQRHVYADPVRQLRHEIFTSWLLSYPEPDRAQYKLRPYQFGPDFLDSIDQLDGIERDRIVSGCVDVLTRRAYEMNSRHVHPYRTSEAAGSPQTVRADKATAWRCSLQAGTPAARRLMWWELPDGGVELARVATHDDHTELR